MISASEIDHSQPFLDLTLIMEVSFTIKYLTSISKISQSLFIIMLLLAITGAIRGFSLKKLCQECNKLDESIWNSELVSAFL